MTKKFIEKLQTPVHANKHLEKSMLLKAIQVGIDLEKAVFN